MQVIQTLRENPVEGDRYLAPGIKSLKDFGPNDKIGVVAPDAQQAIALRKAAQQQLGDAHALDKNLVTISSADGEQACESCSDRHVIVTI